MSDAASHLKLFEFTWNYSKELMTLAAAIVTITVTFKKDVFKASPGAANIFLILGWISYALCIVGGLGVYGCIIGELKFLLTSGQDVPSLAGPTAFAKFQLTTFALGTLLLVLYASVLAWKQRNISATESAAQMPK